MTRSQRLGQMEGMPAYLASVAPALIAAGEQADRRALAERKASHPVAYRLTHWRAA